MPALKTQKHTCMQIHKYKFASLSDILHRYLLNIILGEHHPRSEESNEINERKQSRGHILCQLGEVGCHVGHAGIVPPNVPPPQVVGQHKHNVRTTFCRRSAGEDKQQD